MSPKNKSLDTLLGSIRACSLCGGLPLGPRPIVQAHHDSRILIAGQAPGQRTHEKGIPFDDPSGKRLRDWLGVDREEFYDSKIFAIVPMGFCYPGRGLTGDLPPRPECAPKWRNQLLGELQNIEFTLVIGHYALDWHLGDQRLKTLTDTVLHWRSGWPDILPLPHPSPRNNRWLRNNQWFDKEVLPALKTRIRNILIER